MNNKFLNANNSDQLDTYEAEIIEDIPEQFDLSRYKKSSQTKPLETDRQYRQAQQPPQQQPYHTMYSNVTQNPISHQYQSASSLVHHDSNAYQTNPAINRDLNYKPMIQHPATIPVNTYNDYTYTSSKKVSKSAIDSNSQAQLYNPQQQFAHYQYVHPAPYQYNTNSANYPNQPVQTTNQPPITQQRYQDYITPPAQTSAVQFSSGYDTISSTTSSKKKSSKYDYDNKHSRYPNSPTTSTTITTSNPPWTTRARSDERKKNSFEDEENDVPGYEKKEYFLKGGDDLPNSKKWLSTRENVDDKKSLKSDAYSRSDSGSIHFSQSIEPTKSNIKPAIKSRGVTFDEKLEVYEVKNPHYGLEIKSEKREMKKKKKDRQKEEETFHKTKLDMKAKIQNQNMILYNVSLTFRIKIFY